MVQKKYVSLSKLSTFLDNLKTAFATITHKHTISDITDYTVDSALSSTSTNPVQNKVLDAEFDSIATAMNALESVIDGKANAGHNHDSAYDSLGAADEALASAKSYADTKTSGLASTSTVDSKISTHNTSTSAHNDIRVLISDLTTKLSNFLDVDDTTTDQLSEVLALINNNKGTLESLTTSKINVSDIVNNLTTNSTSKVLSAAQGVTIKNLIDALQTELDSHTHAIVDVTGLQSALDGKAASSHGTHVSYSTTAPVMDGTASVGTASTVARSDHKHPTDTTRASQIDFDTHTTNSTVHVTSAERTNWNAAKTHADSTHAPSDAEKNQNAFSNITVGTTTVAADSATDTVTFVGSNVTITPDATNDKITFSVANGSTNTKGVVQLTNSTSSTSTTTAATPNSVKSAYDLANTAKTAAATAQSTAEGKANASHTHTVANITDLTATVTELNYMDGVTSNVQTQLDGKSSTSHTHSAATTSAAGFMSASDKSKLDGITASADSVSFSRSLTSGTKVGTITINGSGTDLYAPTNTDTHYVSGTVVNNSTSATSNTTSALTNGNVYLNHVENGTVKNSHKISGSGATTVTSDASGNITVSSTNTTYGVATSSTLGLVKSGTDITVDSSGNVSVNDDSHNHVISNVDNLQASLDAKQATITGAATTITGSNLTASRALISNSSGKVAVSDVTSTELGYLDGVTSNIQTQLDGKTSTSVIPNNSGEIKTKYRIAQKGYTSGATWYYKICDLPTNNSGNYASAIISGRIGGWTSGNMSYVNSLIWNRDTPGIALMDIAGAATSMSTIWNIADLVLYTNGTSATAANTASLYIKCYGYFTFDLDLELFQSGASITYDGSYVTTTPSGVLAAQSSTTTKRVEIVNGQLMVNGTALLTATGNAASATKATQDASGNVITSTYETKSDATAKLNEAKTYAASQATQVKNELLNGAGAAYDTLKELGDLIDENTTAIDALETVASNKMDKVNPTGSGNVSIGRADGSTVGTNSIAVGNGSKATASNSIAIGSSTTASGENSTVIGTGATASGVKSVAFGDHNIASGEYATAMGCWTNAPGTAATSLGNGTTANGWGAMASGIVTNAKGLGQHVFGAYNIPDSNTISEYSDVSDHLIIVGNGDVISDDGVQSNAMTLDWSGNAWFSGDVYIGSTSGTNKDGGSKKLATTELATQSTDGLLSAVHKIQLDYGGIPIVNAASTDGAAYTATIPTTNGVFELNIGMTLIIRPEITSTTTTPTLNVNGLGAKTIRIPVAYNTSLTTEAPYAQWLVSNKPITVQYNGSYWVTSGFSCPSSKFLYGKISGANVTCGYNNNGTYVDTTVGEAIEFLYPSVMSLSSETWTFELEDGTTVTKNVVVS